jgi:hypothetical protein
MSTHINKSFWAKQTAQLPVLAANNYLYSDFATAVLQNIVESLDLERATYLTCAPEDEPGVYEVSGESFPADRWFAPLKSSILQLLSQDIIMKGTSERYMDDTFTIDNRNLFVRVFQISLPKYGTQHILVLTYCLDNSQPSKLSNNDKRAAFEYLNLFAYIAISMYLGKAEVIKFIRRQNAVQTE